jgi:hypothetical protein
MTSGRASQSWVRLAEVMAKAEDVRERYFGTALLAAELGRSGIEPAQTRLLKDFPSLVELDRSIPARVSAIGYKSVVDPGEGGPFECWYYQVLVYFLDTRMRLGAVVGSTSNTWEPRPGAQCILPELHNFYMTQLMRRFELIAQHGASGYFWPFSRKEDLSPTQAARLTERCSQASAMFTPLIQVYPEVKDATGALRFYASFYAPALQGKAVGPEVRLVLRNPRLAFEPELAKLSAADSERRYTSLGENYNLWGPGPTRWYIGRVGDRWVIYKFKSDGCTDILIWGPLAKSGEYLMMLEPKQAGRADLSDCYFVCPGRRYYKSGEQKMRCIYVYDRIAKNWLELFPDQPFEYVYDAKIFGDKIVYTFLYNPVIDAAGSHSSDDYEKRGDPLRGVMQYDLKSKLYTLLASNRRDSAAAPVEGLDRSCEAIVRINDDEFSLTNKEGKGLNKVFNMRAGTWRDQSSADKAAAKLMNGSPWDYCSVSGLNWQLSVDHTDNVLLCSTRTGNPPRLRIPLDMIDDGLTAKLAQYPDNLRYYLERKKQVWTDVKMTPEGAAFIVGSVYYWVPLEQLQQVIKQALESSGSAASAKPEDPKSKPATPAAPGATTATPVNSARDPSTTP